MSETDVAELGMTEARAPGITPFQTVGPFFSFALTPGAGDAYTPLAGSDLITEGTVGDPIRIEGRVFDGEGVPVPDAMLEIWHADGAGRYASGGSGTNISFKGFGRTGTASDGGFSFRTVKPGGVPAADGSAQAPHINVSLFARGIIRRMFTRIYFDGDSANGRDPILGLVPADRRTTLVARREGTVDGLPRYRFDIRLQGEMETVFFEA